MPPRVVIWFQMRMGFLDGIRIPANERMLMQKTYFPQ